MQFGYGLITCQRFPGEDRSDAELYREALDLAVEAEELGFDSVWTSEHHFWDDAYAPSLLPLSAAMAARTTTVRIGTERRAVTARVGTAEEAASLWPRLDRVYPTYESYRRNTTRTIPIVILEPSS